MANRREIRKLIDKTERERRSRDIERLQAAVERMEGDRRKLLEELAVKAQKAVESAGFVAPNLKIESVTSRRGASDSYRSICFIPKPGSALHRLEKQIASARKAIKRRQRASDATAASLRRQLILTTGPLSAEFLHRARIYTRGVQVD